MVKCVVHYNSASTAGVEDVEVSIFNTWVTEIRGGECSSMKWGGIDWLVLATSTLMDDAIFEGQVADVLGRVRTCVLISINQWIMSQVAKVKFHPFSSWMVVLHRHFCLCRDVNSDAL